MDRLNAIALTHGDVAHVEGYSRLAEEFRPKMIYTSGARSRSPVYRRIVRGLEATPSKWRVVAAGDEICGWRVLHPGSDQDFSRGDDEALVLSKTTAGKTMTLLSDLGRNGQQALAVRGELKSHVVIAGAPTEGEPLGPELMDPLQTELIVITGNDAKTQRALTSLRSRSTNVISTIEKGAITFSGSDLRVRD